MLKALLDRLRQRESVGARGERIAARFLRSLGYRIVARNVRVRIGRSAAGRAVWGEIDIVAYEGEILAIVEVKTRRSEGLYPIEASIDARKRRLLAHSARRYRRLMGVADEPFRFDAITVVVAGTGPPRLSLTRGYFRDGVQTDR
jgi:putative endonuclease